MIKKIISLFLLLILSSAAGAFGLGGIQVDSTLNQPLQARVELISISSSEVDNIKVGLAGAEEFQKAGVNRTFLLSKLRFRLMAPEGETPYILITTRDSVREPYLNFLIKAIWPQGSMIREFTVLLDPPNYAPPVTRQAETVTPVASKPVVAARQPAQPASYGPIQRSDTLWVIAGKVQAGSDVSRNQTMMALLKANPDAFVNNNINQLKRGAILAIPSHDEVTAISQAEARAQVKQQMAEWRNRRTGTPAQRTPKLAEKAPPVPEPVADTTTPPVAQVEPPVTLPEADTSAQTVPEPVATEPPAKPDEGTKRLRVLDADGNWVVTDENPEAYPARESDKIREAIRDSEQELVAVQAINKDIIELRAALESKVDALRKALQEKDAELDALRKQIEETGQAGTAAIEGSSPSKPTAAPVDPGQASPQGIDGVAPIQQPVALSSYWKSEYWMILMGVIILILSILLLFSLRRRSVQPTTMTPDLFQVAPEDDDAGIYAPAPAKVQATATRDEPVAGESRGVVVASVPEMSGSSSLGSGTDIASLLTEADIYLAYRRYSQAEALIREAIEQHPDSLELQAKLLEIHAFRRDPEAFRRALDKVYPLLLQSPDLWEKIAEMGRHLLPDHPAFKVVTAPDVMTREPGPGERLPGASVDEPLPSGEAMVSDEPLLGDELFDIDLDIDEDDLSAGDQGKTDSLSLDDLVDDRPQPYRHELPSIEIDIDEEDLDFDLDFDDEEEALPKKER